jgi:hypothetical protein
MPFGRFLKYFPCLYCGGAGMAIGSIVSQSHHHRGRTVAMRALHVTPKGEEQMRVRMICGALALGAALFCTTSVTPASAQAARTYVATAVPMSERIMIYPGSFPSTSGPGYCLRTIVILMAKYNCAPDHDYSNGGSIQMWVNDKEDEAYIADINGLEVPQDMIPQKGETAVPTIIADPPAGGGNDDIQ